MTKLTQKKKPFRRRTITTVSLQKALVLSDKRNLTHAGLEKRSSLVKSWSYWNSGMHKPTYHVIHVSHCCSGEYGAWYHFAFLDYCDYWICCWKELQNLMYRLCRDVNFVNHYCNVIIYTIERFLANSVRQCFFEYCRRFDRLCDKLWRF